MSKTFEEWVNENYTEDMLRMCMENQELRYVIEDLKQQIRKMKHCENCKYYTERS